VVQGLLDEGYRVRVLDDLSSGSIHNVPSSADLVIGDVADASVADAAISGQMWSSMNPPIAPCSSRWRTAGHGNRQCSRDPGGARSGAPCQGATGGVGAGDSSAGILQFFGAASKARFGARSGGPGFIDALPGAVLQPSTAMATRTRDFTYVSDVVRPTLRQ
jgi:hypothetical protein